MTQDNGTQHLQHLVGGRWHGEAVVERRNPADPGDVVYRSPEGSAAEVAAAIDAAAAAQPTWAATPPPRRGAILHDASEHLRARARALARDLTREEGKTFAEALAEVLRAADVLRYFAGEGWRIAGMTLPASAPRQLNYTVREPLGVVGVITPWNFPIAIPAWKLGPALVSGNSVVFKPASIAGASAVALVRALVDAGLPEGVLNLVLGEGRRVGVPLADDPRVAAVTFTGSTTVGKDIHRRLSARLGRVQLEMGGKNPLVVLDDADCARAAQVAAVGAFGLTGQACTATSRVLVTPGIRDRFVAALVDEARAFTPGNGLDEGVRMGPVVSEQQLETDLRYLTIATEQGAEVVHGGACREALYLEPAVLTGVRNDHRVARDEVFGPVVAVIDVADLDEAVEVANDTPYGLSAGICTRSLPAAQEFAGRVRAGVVKVNRPTTGLDLNVPFGGLKDSSTGTFREQGPTAVDFFTSTKTVYLGWD